MSAAQDCADRMQSRNRRQRYVQLGIESNPSLEKSAGSLAGAALARRGARHPIVCCLPEGPWNQVRPPSLGDRGHFPLLFAHAHTKPLLNSRRSRVLESGFRTDASVAQFSLPAIFGQLAPAFARTCARILCTRPACKC